jgi:hypothetical protein
MLAEREIKEARERDPERRAALERYAVELVHQLKSTGATAPVQVHSGDKPMGWFISGFLPTASDLGHAQSSYAADEYRLILLDDGSLARYTNRADSIEHHEDVVFGYSRGNPRPSGLTDMRHRWWTRVRHGREDRLEQRTNVAATTLITPSDLVTALSKLAVENRLAPPPPDM